MQRNIAKHNSACSLPTRSFGARRPTGRTRAEFVRIESTLDRATPGVLSIIEHAQNMGGMGENIHFSNDTNVQICNVGSQHFSGREDNAPVNASTCADGASLYSIVLVQFYKQYTTQRKNESHWLEYAGDLGFSNRDNSVGITTC